MSEEDENTGDETTGIMQELLSRDDVNVILPTESFIGTGAYELIGQRAGEMGVETDDAVLIVFYNRDNDDVHLLVIPRFALHGFVQDLVTFALPDLLASVGATN